MWCCCQVIRFILIIARAHVCATLAFIHRSYFKITFIIFLLAQKGIDHLSRWSLIEICDTITITRKMMEANQHVIQSFFYLLMYMLLLKQRDWWQHKLPLSTHTFFASSFDLNVPEEIKMSLRLDYYRLCVYTSLNLMTITMMTIMNDFRKIELHKRTCRHQNYTA